MKVFVSYCHGDSTFAMQLSKDLRARGVSVWLDEWEIRVGDEIRQKVEHGIETYDFFAILLSKHSVQSRWVEKELNAAYVKELNSDKTVILPVLIEECKIPLLISGKKYADFRTSYGDGFTGLLDALSTRTPTIRRKIKTDVLIVDDDLTHSRQIAGAFEHYGLSVTEATDVRAVIELARRYTPRMIIVDIWYCELGDGLAGCFELIHQFRRVCPDAKIVGMSPFRDLPEDFVQSLDVLITKTDLGGDVDPFHQLLAMLGE